MLLNFFLQIFNFAKVSNFCFKHKVPIFLPRNNSQHDEFLPQKENSLGVMPGLIPMDIPMMSEN